MIWLWWGLVGLVFLFGVMALTGAPYVPSRRQDVEQAFTDLYQMSDNDTLVDMGSGDGTVLRVARRHGATVYGIELNPLLVFVSRWRFRGDARAKIVCGNLSATNFPDTTTIVYTFGDSRDIARMARAVQQQANRLRRPLWFVSYAFAVPGWEAERQSGPHILYKVEPHFTHRQP